MTTQSFEDIISDENYCKGFVAATKKAEKKYSKLLEASKAWFNVYEVAFGAPEEDGTPEYWELKKLLK